MDLENTKDVREQECACLAVNTSLVRGIVGCCVVLVQRIDELFLQKFSIFLDFLSSIDKGFSVPSSIVSIKVSPLIKKKRSALPPVAHSMWRFPEYINCNLAPSHTAKSMFHHMLMIFMKK